MKEHCVNHALVIMTFLALLFEVIGSEYKQSKRLTFNVKSMPHIFSTCKL